MARNGRRETTFRGKTSWCNTSPDGERLDSLREDSCGTKPLVTEALSRGWSRLVGNGTPLGRYGSVALVLSGNCGCNDAETLNITAGACNLTRGRPVMVSLYFLLGADIST